MQVTRRSFLTRAASAGAGGLFGFLGLDLSPTVAYANSRTDAVRRCRITTTICPYCAVGCGALVMAENHRVVNIEGDPDHPINEGALCPKGASLSQMVNNGKRLNKPLYRAPGATEFKEVEWGWAAREIAKRIKKTRDATFSDKNAKGQVVNRTMGIASVGSAALDNEECWLLQAMLRSLGLAYIEHQARI